MKAVRYSALISATLAGLAISSGGAHGATLSWSHAGATIGHCYVDRCASTMSMDVHSDTGGADINAAAVVKAPARGIVAAWATPDDGGLMPDLHAVAVTYPAGGGQINLGYGAVQAAQVFEWTGSPFNIDPSVFVGTVDYNATVVPPLASGIIAGFAILDASIIADHSLADPFYDFGMSSGVLTDAFRGDCSSPGAIAIADGGIDHAKGSQSYSLAATACHGVLHVNTGDQFVLWTKMFVSEYAPGVFDASHTFHIGLNPDLPPETVRTLASSVKVVPFSYGVPEPTTWALMVLGFGAVGAGLRRRQAVVA